MRLLNRQTKMPVKQLRKAKPDSDSDSDSSYNSSVYSSDSDNTNELQETLSELFPSKYLKRKYKSKSKSSSKSKVGNKITKKTNKSKKQELSDDDDDDDSNDNSFNTEDCSDDDDYETISGSDEDEDEEDNDEDEEDNDDNNNNSNNPFKIMLTIGGKPSSNMRNSMQDNDDDAYSTEDEKTFMKETYEHMPKTNSMQSLNTLATQSPTNASKQKSKSKKSNKEDFLTVDIEDKYKEIKDLKKVLHDKLKNNPKNKIIKKALEQCDQKIQKLIKHARNKNARTFEELLYKSDMQENTDELGYFKRKLSNKEQLTIMNDLRELNNKVCIDKPYRLALLQSALPANLKAIAFQRLNQLASMEPGDNEYYKLKNWVDGFMRIPFGVYKNIAININDGLDKCSDFVVNAKKQLDNCVYGLDDAKMQVMQMIGQWISNPKSLGTAIAVKGPPGTGKTSLIKDGISKILGREFAFIALGGCGDSSYLEGHGYTYEGSTYGKIVQILIDSKCMNPVIYFDELDKVSDTPRGQEIISLLTHLTDTTQNSQFRDKYFSEVDFDLSKCLFIFSYNDETLVNPILKDRMYRIETKGYNLKEKQIIARNYLLPKIREQVGFEEGQIIISDEVLSHIISNQAKGESGVRNLKRCLEIVHTKLNLYRLVKSDTALFEKEMGLQVSFPYTLTKKDVDTLVKTDETMNQSVLCSMYV